MKNKKLILEIGLPTLVILVAIISPILERRQTKSILNETPIVTIPTEQEIQVKKENKKINYTITYPKDWKYTVYGSNGFETVGLYDPIAQQQDKNIPDLIQGAKIEITSTENLPKGNLKAHILEQNEFVKHIEPITKIQDIVVDVEGSGKVDAVRYEQNLERGSAIIEAFIIRELYYRITMIIKSSNFEDNYFKVFDEVVSSFRIIEGS